MNAKSVVPVWVAGHHIYVSLGGRNVTAKHYSAAELTKLKRSALLDWEAALRRIMAGEDPFSASIEDDRSEEAKVLGLDDPDNAPVPTDIITGANPD